MKKLQLNLITALTLIIFMSSCSKTKDYQCVCTNTITGNTISNTNIEAESEAEAITACDAKESIILPDRCEIKN